MTARGLSILGSTGSIGCNTLRVVAALGGDRFRVIGLAAGHNVAKLAEQIEAFQPQLVSVESEEAAHQLHTELRARGIAAPRIMTGEDGLVELATHERADVVVSGTVGAVGFVPTLRALEAGKRVALANKETLVMAGELVTRTAREGGGEIVPVDSEHSAVLQCITGRRPGSWRGSF